MVSKQGSLDEGQETDLQLRPCAVAVSELQGAAGRGTASNRLIEQAHEARKIGGQDCVFPLR